MAEYIRRDDAVCAIREFSKTAVGIATEALVWAENVILDTVPSADVAEVVRCKDCIHRPIHIDGEHPDSPYIDDHCCYKDYTCPYLCDDDYYNRMPDDDWFCNHGERMDGGT